MNTSNSSSTTSNTNEDNKQQEKSLVEEKKKVKTQIKDLKELIERIELELDIITFGTYEIVGKSSSNNDCLLMTHTYQNIYHILQYEMHKFSGFYCSKVTESEFIINISSISSKKSLYVIRISTLDEKVRLRGWVLPWGITIDKIISDTPLQQSQDIIPFLRNCKRTIDCHADREEQFKQLKKATSSIKNTEINATLGYITIICHFIGLHNMCTNETFNLIVTMHYGTARTRPMSINIEWNLKREISEQMVQIKMFVKCFKTQPLINAFEHIMKETHTLYCWKAEKYNDSILDVPPINFPSESDSLTEISDDNEVYIRKRRKRKRSDNHNKRSSSDVESSQMISEIISSFSEHEHNEATLVKQISDSKFQRGKSLKQNSSRANQKKPNVNAKSVIKRNKLKLQQTELNFKKVPASSQLMSKIKSVKDKRSEINEKKTVTSTPKAVFRVPHKNQPSINSLELSPIQTTTAKSTINTHGKKIKNKKKQR